MELLEEIESKMFHRFLTNSHASNEAAASNGGVHNGNVVSKLLLENAVEVLTAADSSKTVGIGQVGEDTDLIAALKLCSGGHG